MQRPESNDMATASKPRLKSRPGSDAHAGPVIRSITDALISAIADSGLSTYALSTASGVNNNSIWFFIHRKKSLFLDTADKLAVPLGLVLIHKARNPGSEVRADDPTQPISSGLRSAIADSELSKSALARASGVSSSAVCDFVRCESSIWLRKADKLAVTLGLELVRVPKVEIPQPNIPTQPISSGLRSAIADSGLSIYALSMNSFVKYVTILNFMHRDSSIHLDTFDKLAVPLGLRLIRKAHGQGSEVHAGPTSQSITDALILAIVESSLSSYALFMASGVLPARIRGFVGRKSSLDINSLDKLAAPLGLELVRVPKVEIPQPKARPGVPPQRLAAELRAAIVNSKLSAFALSVRSGVSDQTIRRFVNEQH
jgi:plasmid maintenance system antidote protein VapI